MSRPWASMPCVKRRSARTPCVISNGWVMLQTVDNLWKDHLLSMDHLKEGIGLRGYAQQNPLLVYKKEGFELFQDLIERIKEETVGIMFRIQLAEPPELSADAKRTESGADLFRR